MNSYFLAAGVLTVILATAHSIMGERFFLGRLWKKESPDHIGSEAATNRTTRTAWHLTTIAWMGMGAILISFAMYEPPAGVPIVAIVIGLTFLASSLLSAIESRGRHLSWFIFLSIAILTFLGVAAVG